MSVLSHLTVLMNHEFSCTTRSHVQVMFHVSRVPLAVMFHVPRVPLSVIFSCAGRRMFCNVTRPPGWCGLGRKAATCLWGAGSWDPCTHRRSTSAFHTIYNSAQALSTQYNANSHLFYIYHSAFSLRSTILY